MLEQQLEEILQQESQTPNRFSCLREYLAALKRELGHNLSPEEFIRYFLGDLSTEGLINQNNVKATLNNRSMAGLIEHDGFIYYPGTSRLIIPSVSNHSGKAIQFTEVEGNIVNVLMENAGDLVPHSTFKDVLGWSSGSDKAFALTLRVNIGRIRKKSGDEAIRNPKQGALYILKGTAIPNHNYFQTVYNHGYMFLSAYT